VKRIAKRTFPTTRGRVGGDKRLADLEHFDETGLEIMTYLPIIGHYRREVSDFRAKITTQFR